MYSAILTTLCTCNVFHGSTALVAKASSLSRIHDHTQTHHTLSRTLLDE